LPFSSGFFSGTVVAPGETGKPKKIATSAEDMRNGKEKRKITGIMTPEGPKHLFPQINPRWLFN
jgi:hypothetical protein